MTVGERSDRASSDIGPFAVVPVALLNDRAVSDRALRVWCAVASFADRKTGECFPLQEAIAERLGASTPTVSRGVHELVATGWLQTIPRKANDGTKRKIGTLYTVLYQRTERADMKVPTERADSDGTERATGARSNARASVLSGINRPENQPPNGDSPSKRSRPRNDIWDAIARACFLPLDSSKLTKASSRMLAVASADIRKVGGTAAQVPEVAAAYRARFPGAELTPTALAKWWPSLVSTGTDDDGDPGPSQYDDLRHVR